MEIWKLCNPTDIMELVGSLHGDHRRTLSIETIRANAFRSYFGRKCHFIKNC